MNPIDQFGVHGHHPAVCDVELPSWLPRDVMEGMVNNFEAVLRGEIFAMMLEKVKHCKVRRPSEQSTSPASTGSHKNQLILPRNRGRTYGVRNINYTNNQQISNFITWDKVQVGLSMSLDPWVSHTFISLFIT